MGFDNRLLGPKRGGQIGDGDLDFGIGGSERQNHEESVEHSEGCKG
jgi:hypothetical protein